MLKRIIFLLGLLVCFGASATSIKDFTPWKYFKIKAPDNTSVCTLITAGRGNDTIKNIALKYLGGDQPTYILIYKNTWNIPHDMQLPVSFSFMDGEPLVLNGIGNGKILAVAINKNVFFDFFEPFGHAPFMRIGFPQGKEPAWNVNIKNIKQPLLKFMNCMNDKLRTQPF